MLVAIGLFVGTAVIAYRAADLSSSDIDWAPLLLAGLVGVPAATATNAAEYRLIASITGRRVGVLQSVRVSILASAANLLPIPGAVLVRVRALRQAGAGYGEALTATLIVGLYWVGTTACVVGAVYLFDDHLRPTAAALVAGGLLIAGAATGLLRAGAKGGASDARVPVLALGAVGVEIAAVAAVGLRFYLVTDALGFDASIASAAALALAPAVSSAVGFFPGGFGLREVLGAGIAAVVGLPAAAGALVMVADRLLGVIVTGLAALAMWPRRELLGPATDPGVAVPLEEGRGEDGGDQPVP